MRLPAYKCRAQGGVLNAMRRALLVMKWVLQSGLHVLQERAGTTMMIERLTSHKKYLDGLEASKVNGCR